MLFKPELIAEIKAGRKTQTRRVCKPGEVAVSNSTDLYPAAVVIRSVIAPGFADFPVKLAQGRGRDKWRVGNIYTICPGRGKPGVGFIQLTVIRQERVQDITEADAEREGMQPSVLHGGVIMTARQHFEGIWWVINTRKGTRWQDNPDVWVLTFEYVGEERP